MLPDTSNCKFIEPQELNNRFAEGPVKLIDVRTPASFEKGHIAGSTNHCVYETVFMEKFPESHPQKDESMVLYGEGDPYKADLAAFGRLSSLGYENISVLKGGITAWQNAGFTVEGNGTGDDTPLPRMLSLDTQKTRIRWIGRNLINQHNGAVSASFGYVELSPCGEPVTGKVAVDLNTLVCHDITDSNMAKMLIGHLASPDFFDIESYPEASFTLSSMTPIEDITPGLPNFQVQGTLTARGQSIPIAMDALVSPIDEGFVFQALFNFDRTHLGAVYGSGRFFEQLGMHLVNDLVTIEVLAFFNDPQASQ